MIVTVWHQGYNILIKVLHFWNNLMHIVQYTWYSKQNEEDWDSLPTNCLKYISFDYLFSNIYLSHILLLSFWIVIQRLKTEKVQIKYLFIWVFLKNNWVFKIIRCSVYQCTLHRNS